MERSEIIFFDELGFGWVVEQSIARQLRPRENESETNFIERTLADLLSSLQ